MRLKSFGLPILIVVVILLGAALLVQQITAAPASKAPENMSMVEGKSHGPRSRGGVQRLEQLPPLPTNNDSFAWDFSHKDLTKLELATEGKQLAKYASFDTATKWPDILPAEFMPDRFMQLGKDPGLGLKELHQKGITGKGVQVAILDNTLLNGHQEYADRIVKYVELGTVASAPELHGAAVASILAGKNVGVAPEAQVTYYAVQIRKSLNESPVTRTFHYLAAAIHKILDDNKNLPPEKRIRVISASIGADTNEEGYAEINAAYRRAKQAGVLVVSTDMITRYDQAVHGLGRDPVLPPNNPNSYQPGSWWADRFFQTGQLRGGLVYAPMDSRTTAAETGTDHYRFYRIGGLSWSVPWMAGMYALVCQVDPNVTPEKFLKVAYDTGDYVTVSRDGKDYKLGPIMNPTKIVEAFQK